MDFGEQRVKSVSEPRRDNMIREWGQLRSTDTLRLYYLGDRTKGVGIGWACSTYGKEEYM